MIELFQSLKICRFRFQMMNFYDVFWMFIEKRRVRFLGFRKWVVGFESL